MMTELVLIWLGSLAALASVAMVVPMDPLTDMIVPFVAAILWGAVSLSSTNVIISDNADPPVTISLQIVMWLALMFALCCVVFGIYQLIHQPASEAEGAANSDFLN